MTTSDNLLVDALGRRHAVAADARIVSLVPSITELLCDLGLALHTALDAEAVLAAHRAAGNSEYDPLLVVPEAELPDFVAGLGDEIVPPAREFMKRLGLLPA